MNRVLNSNIAEPADASLQPSGQLAHSLALFRTAVHAIAEKETARPVAAGWLQLARRRQRRAQRRVVLAWACAAALCLAVIPRDSHAPVAPHPTAAAAAPQAPPSDESYTALLEQVDNEISEPVPTSLAPLTELDSWNSTASNPRTEKKNVTQ